MQRRALGLLVAGAVVLAACGDPRPSSPTAADLRGIDLSPDHTITVDDEGFSPAALEVAAGDVVRLINEGTSLHSFTADERFDSGRMHPGDETTLVLTKPGKIPYFDLENPSHKATLTVIEGRPG